MNKEIPPLRAGDYGAKIPKSGDKKSNGLEEEVDEVAVLPIHKIIASTEEEENSKTKLPEMKSVNVLTTEEATGK